MKLITDKKQTNKQTPQKELYIFFFFNAHREVLLPNPY